MNLAIIGGGSVRTPLLIKGLLSGSGEPPEEVRLYDTDKKRLRLIRQVVSAIEMHYQKRTQIKYVETPEEAFEGADFVFSCFRQGGESARIRDEMMPPSFGLLGQETIGAGGWSMALRTIPPALRYARLLHGISPHAWIINFTNPSGIVTEALQRFSPHKKTIGICDAPGVIARLAAEALGISYADVTMKYFGLNHLGWAYSIAVKGEERLEDLISQYLHRFIDREPLYKKLEWHIRETHLIPNEYLLFYLNTKEVIRSLAESKESRGLFILKANTELFHRLENPSTDPVAAYEDYLFQREHSYMSVESGMKRDISKESLFSSKKYGGYEDVAITIMHALSTGNTVDLPVIVRNGDYCPYLQPDDTIEVICRIGATGEPKPIYPLPTYPKSCENLIRTVKAYERLTAEAASVGNRHLAVQALALNPLVDPEKADELAQALEAGESS